MYIWVKEAGKGESFRLGLQFTEVNRKKLESFKL